MKSFLGLIVLLFSFGANAQLAWIRPEYKSSRKTSVLAAKQQVVQLHEGALLVRLITKKNSIVALRRMGKLKRAAKLEKKQGKLNRKIINAFRSRFNFCPVYFFFSNYSKNIQERDFNSVLFLNDSLKPDSTIKFTKEKFFIAEFTSVNQDTANYFSGYSYIKKNRAIIKEKEYYGGPDLGIRALIIRSDKFVQLRRPFPFYSRTFGSLPVGRRPKRTVKKMNNSLPGITTMLFSIYKKHFLILPDAEHFIS